VLLFLLWSATVCVDYYDTWNRFRSRGIFVFFCSNWNLWKTLKIVLFAQKDRQKSSWECEVDRQTCVVLTLFVLLRSSCVCMKICFAVRHRLCMLWWLHKRKAASKRTSSWCSHSFRSCSLAWNSTRAWSCKLNQKKAWNTDFKSIMDSWRTDPAQKSALNVNICKDWWSPGSSSQKSNQICSRKWPTFVQNIQHSEKPKTFTWDALSVEKLLHQIYTLKRF
jgi:hypothetical protein